MTKLIKLSDIHYIIVDDSEIKKGDFYAIANISGQYKVYQCSHRKKDRVYFGNLSLHDSKTKSTASDDVQYCYKVTHSSDPLSYRGLNDKYAMKLKRIYVSDIEQLIYGYNLETLAEEKASALNYQFDDYCGSCYNDYIEGYHEGFKKHQELVKEKILNSQGKNHLQHIYNLLKFIYANVNVKDIENCDFMIKFKNIIEFLTPTKTEWLVQVKDNKITLL